MDIALIHVPVEDVVEDEPSFNPYFNGYCSYTILGVSKHNVYAASFNPYFNGYCSYTIHTFFFRF